MKDIRSSLLLSKSIDINGMTFIQPKVAKIIEIGYQDFILPAFLFFDPKNTFIGNKKIYDYFEDNNMGSYSTLSYLIDSEKEFEELILKFLNLHFRGNIVISDGKIKIDDFLIGEEAYNDICEVLKMCYEFEERLDDKNYGKGSKMVMVDILRKRRKQIEKHSKKDANHESPILGIISVVVTKCNRKEVFEMTHYQLIDFFRTLMREKQYMASLNGAYGGTVDIKNLKNIWANEK